MKFTELLKKLREKSGCNKTDVALRVGFSPSYFMQIESGARGAPPLERCRQIASAMRLSKDETEELVQSAAEERTRPDELLIIKDAYKDHLSVHGGRHSIKGRSSCPHCNKDIDIEVDQEGEISIFAKVIGKVKKVR